MIVSVSGEPLALSNSDYNKQTWMMGVPRLGKISE